MKSTRSKFHKCQFYQLQNVPNTKPPDYQEKIQKILQEPAEKIPKEQSVLALQTHTIKNLHGNKYLVLK